MTADTVADTSCTYGSPRLTTDMGRECAEKRSTTSDRVSAENLSSARSMFCATACAQVTRQGPVLGTRGRGGNAKEHREQTYLDEPRVRPPPVNHAPLDLVARFSRLPAPIELVEAAARRRAAVLRVLRERDRAADAVGLHLRGGRVREGARVAEGHVRLVRRGRGVELVEERGHALALELRVVQDGRAAADVRVLLLNLRRAPLRDERREHGLEGERYEVAVGEEVLEEVVGFGDLGEGAEVDGRIAV